MLIKDVIYAVKKPIKIIKTKIGSVYLNKKEHLIIKKIPAVTIVAAWIKADTGVGTYIASGN